MSNFNLHVLPRSNIYNPKVLNNNILTHADIYDPEVLRDVVLVCTELEHKLRKLHPEDDNPSSSFDVVIEFLPENGGPRECWIYFACWQSRLVFWLDKIPIERLTNGVREVRRPTHQSKLLAAPHKLLILGNRIPFAGGILVSSGPLELVRVFFCSSGPLLTLRYPRILPEDLNTRPNLGNMLRCFPVDNCPRALKRNYETWCPTASWVGRGQLYSIPCIENNMLCRPAHFWRINVTARSYRTGTTDEVAEEIEWVPEAKAWRDIEHRYWPDLFHTRPITKYSIFIGRVLSFFCKLSDLCGAPQSSC